MTSNNHDIYDMLNTTKSFSEGKIAQCMMSEHDSALQRLPMLTGGLDLLSRINFTRRSFPSGVAKQIIYNKAQSLIKLGNFVCTWKILRFLGLPLGSEKL